MAGVFLGEQVDRDTQGEQARLGLGADTKLEVRHLGEEDWLHFLQLTLSRKCFICIYFAHLECGEVGD